MGEFDNNPAPALRVIAESTLENLTKDQLIKLDSATTQELMFIIEAASAQEPPNEAMVTAAGSIALSRLHSPAWPRHDDTLLTTIAQRAFPQLQQ